MAWFTHTHKHTASGEKKEDLWVRCRGCSAHVLKEEWFDNLSVCSKCGYHGRIGARERIELVIDNESGTELDTTIFPADPLDFSDGKATYMEKLNAARKKTGLNSALVSSHAKLHGTEVVVAAMDFRFIGGSLGSAVGEKFYRAADFALSRKIPFIIFCASGGARMQEGMFSLMQMAKTCSIVEKLHNNAIPYISVLTDPTAGGVSASFAMVGDIHLAEPGALIAFAGRRVIEQTIKQKLPDDFQTAEYLLEHGFIDMIVPRAQMRDTLAGVLRYGIHRNKG